MKRKLLSFFLTIITALCLCVSVTACDVLNSLVDGNTDTQNSTQDISDDEEQDSSSGDDEGEEQDLSSGDEGEEQDPSSSDDEGEEQDPSSGDEGEEQDPSSDDEDEEQDPSSSDDEGEEQDPSSSDDEGEEQDQSSGDDDADKEDGGEVVVDFEVRDGNSSYGYCALADETNGEQMQEIYYQMYTACEAFIANTDDVTATNAIYSIAEISYSEYSLTAAEAVSVWKVFYLENPMYYWLSSTCRYTESTSTIYLCIDETYASYSVRAAYDADISAMVEEASALVAQCGTELEKAMAIHDYIIDKIDYAYQSDGTTPETAIWAHNITGVSSQGYGVCEAYSKTYLALCLISGLDCVIATGNAISSGEAHAWNIVKIDGVWYGVDCTWDDTGSDGDLSYVYFGMNDSAISSSRTADSATYGVDYLYGLPEVTACGIQPVTLFKGETSLGMYANIDAAFEAMTDSAADYTIEFYFYNPVGTLVYTSPATTMYIYSEYTPAVNSVTINGVYTALDGGYFYISYLTIQSKLVLMCDLEISNVVLTATDLDLGEYTLTTGGYYCRLDGVIYDSKTTGTISIKSATTSQTVIYAALDVSYYYGSDAIVVYGKVTIDKYVSAIESNYYNVYLQDGASLTVNNLVNNSGSNRAVQILIQFNSVEGYPSLYLDGVEVQTYLVISGYISATEAATADNLSCAIATLGNADEFANIKIYFGSEDKTSSYSVNADNEIVYS